MQVALDDYAWAAGVATELVNTAAEVWRGEDQLPDPAALVAFSDLHGERAGNEDLSGALSELARRAGTSDLRAVHALRTSLRRLIDDPDRDRLVAGATGLTSAARGVTLIPGPAHGSRWAASLREGAGVADALALICGIGVLGVVHTLGPQRFRPCDAATCRGVFIDTTRPGHRRYCMPGLCGNRVNVARHRARRAAAHDPRTGSREAP